MWSEGVIGIPTGEKDQYIPVHYWVKHYELPSKFGIDNGRVSKLTLKVDGVIVANFDRGWDVRPEGFAAEAALAIILKEYN